ncbi:hypothetical protein CesoFtcFv8_014951 [Champsocephalus esox]|uniref:Uncharacterized protein n=1 Tax=Champsocephalus esox TaxID=159716 RepID=A0AAN8BRH6_9TELE|nr:hypothetical protein CesoFtcFv8_014951 [Champsocephalus esox]
MNQQPVVSLNATGGALLLNLSQWVFEHRKILQVTSRKEEEAYFLDFIPPARDAITLPRNVVYIVAAVVLVIVATYAIVGHLINDLMHDLADWFLGPKIVEDNSEEGRAETAEGHRLSACSKLMGEDRMEMEKEGLLPGFYPEDVNYHRPSVHPPYPGEKRISAHSVTFTCPMTSYATSP